MMYRSSGVGLLVVSFSLVVGVFGCDIPVEEGPDIGQGEPDGSGTDTRNGMDTDNGDDDGGIVTPECNSYTELEGSIDSDKTLGTDCYVASSGLKVSDGATLTIEPGVVLEFEENTGLTVNGKLKAVGSSDSPVVFTGSNKMPGWWNGVTFKSSKSSINELDHVVIEYGGGDGNSKANLNLTQCCGNETTVTVTNTTLRHSAGYGFSTGADKTAFTEFKNNTVTDNASGAGTIRTDHIDELDSATDYSGNGTDAIVVTSGKESEQVTWPTVGIPFRVESTMTIESSGDVTIDPNNTFKFAENQAFKINGKLAISGKQQKPVTFTGTKEQAGWWAGITYDSTDSTDNVIEYAVVEYGGKKDDANLSLQRCCGNNTRVAVRNSTFANSEGYGLQAENGTYLEAFANNTLEKNAQGAASVDAALPGSFEASNTFKGNQKDYIFVGGKIDTDSTWQAFDVPYRVDSKVTVEDGVNLTLKAGAVLEFGENQNFEVNGTMTAKGKSSDKIEFRGVDSSKGYWGALVFNSTDSQDNVLEHVVVSDAGENQDANLVFSQCCGNTTSAKVNDVTLKNGKNAGIAAESNVTLRGCSNLSVMNCASEGSYNGTTKSLSAFKTDACN